MQADAKRSIRMNAPFRPTTTTTETPPPDFWPDWLPPWSACSPRLRERLIELLLRLPSGWPRRAILDSGALRDPRGWETITVPVCGAQAKRQGVRYIRVTRWMWEYYTAVYPGAEILWHGDGDGRFYPVPSHPKIKQWLKDSGKAPNSVTLGAHLLVVLRLEDWHSRAEWVDDNKIDSTAFNLGSDKYPKTPDGEDARRARTSFKMACEHMAEHDVLNRHDCEPDLHVPSRDASASPDRANPKVDRERGEP